MMAGEQSCISSNAPQNRNIPDSTTIVEVSIINTTSQVINIPHARFVQQYYKGLDVLDVLAFSFFIELPGGRKLLFDLGVRKDWWNLAPRITQRMKDGGWIAEIEKSVAEILEDNGLKPESIEAVIWR
jgi:hypothetical protein